VLMRDHLDTPWQVSATVDPAEVAKFTALAEEWWNPDGRFRPIHKFNPTRRDYILSRIGRHFGMDPENENGLDGIRILDVGCGAGLLCEPLAERGADVVGIDATARNIEVARWHAKKSGVKVHYRHSLAAHLAAANEQFDVVLNTEVIEHVRNPQQLMRECCGLVRPSGMMVVATLNRTLRAYLLAIVGAEYVLRWLPKGTLDWRRFLRPEEVAAMLRPHGLAVTEEVGVSYNPLTGRWGLSGNTNVNYLLLASRGSP